MKASAMNLFERAHGKLHGIYELVGHHLRTQEDLGGEDGKLSGVARVALLDAVQAFEKLPKEPAA